MSVARLVPGDPRRHAGGILAIFNDAIANSTAIYDYRLRTAADMASWFDAKIRNGYPVICAESESGEFMGFASYGRFRERPAYKYSVEHSVYVDARFRRQGLGRVLLRAIIASAQGNDYHVMVGGIDASNEVSIRLHESAGFERCGVVRQAAFKFGRWLDLAMYQLILPTPATPADG